MSRYLDMGMVPAGEGHAAGDDPSPTSVVGTEAAASTPGEVVSITPTTSAHERCGRTRETSSHDRSSDFALNSDGEQVSVHAVEEETETPRGPPPPQPVGSVASALAGGLHGVWMEPLDDAPPVDPEASSSSSSASSDHVASHATTTLTTGLPVLTWATSSTSSITMPWENAIGLGTLPTSVPALLHTSTWSSWTSSTTTSPPIASTTKMGADGPEHEAVTMT